MAENMGSTECEASNGGRGFWEGRGRVVDGYGGERWLATRLFSLPRYLR